MWRWKKRKQLGKSFCCGFDLHLGLLSSASETGRHAFWAAGVFRLEARTHVFGTCFQHQWIGGQVYRPLSLSAQEWIDKKLFSTKKKGTDLLHDAELVSEFVASMSIYTKTVIRNGQKHMAVFRNDKRNYGRVVSAYQPRQWLVGRRSSCWNPRAGRLGLRPAAHSLPLACWVTSLCRVLLCWDHREGSRGLTRLPAERAVHLEFEVPGRAFQAAACGTGGRARALAALLGETVVKAPETWFVSLPRRHCGALFFCSRTSGGACQTCLLWPKHLWLDSISSRKKKFNEEISFTHPFWRRHTPWSSFLLPQYVRRWRIVCGSGCGVPKGRWFGERPVLLDNGDDGQDTEPENFWSIRTRSAPMASGSRSKMGRRSRASSSSQQRKERRNKITLVKPYHHKGVHLGRKDGKKTAGSQDQWRRVTVKIRENSVPKNAQTSRSGKQR